MDYKSNLEYLQKFIAQHKDELEAEDYTMLIEKLPSTINEALTLDVLKILHNAGVEPWTAYDPDLFAFSIKALAMMRRVGHPIVMSRMITPWTDAAVDSAPVLEIIKELKLLGAKVYKFEKTRGTAQVPQYDYIISESTVDGSKILKDLVNWTEEM